MGLTRRELVGRAAGSALAGTGIYALVDRLVAAPPARAAVRVPLLPEQHVLQNLRIVVSDGVEVFAPPLHSAVVTATLRVDETRGALAEARVRLEHALEQLDGRFSATPSGLGVTVGWGLPYFERYVPGQARRRLPIDRRASRSRGRPVRALEDAIRFPSDPESVILEQNDVAVLLRSDSLAHIQHATEALFGGSGDLFAVTSIRRGFAGGGFAGRQSLPKQMAMAAKIPGAESIPDAAELFLGFTSTQKQAPGRYRITNFETLGYTDVRTGGYFAHGTNMHLSHLFEDLEAWYGTFTRDERVESTFSPGLRIGPDILTVGQGPEQAAGEADVLRGYRRHGRIGHSGSIQPASRLQQRVIGPDGTRYEQGTPIPHRADFNTLDHPFAWTRDGHRDGFAESPRAGLHFVVFNPTSDDFRRGRLAMDGALPSGRVVDVGQRSRRQGFNDVLATTHRQNFLVPPRRHRSFPLSELPA